MNFTNARVKDLLALSEAFAGEAGGVASYDRLLDSLMGVLACASCSIHLLDDTGRSVYLVASKGVPQAIPKSILENTSVESLDADYMRPLLDGRPYFPLDYTPAVMPFQGGREFAEKESELVSTLIKIPLLSSDCLVGALTIVKPGGTRAWLEENAEWLVDVGRHVGSMLGRFQAAETALSREILKERRRVGRELHDNLAQCIAGLRMMAERVADKWEARELESLGEDIAALRRMADESYSQVRSELEGLRFLKEINGDVAAEISAYLAAFSARWGIETRLTIIDPAGCLVLFGVEALQLFRIVQESLTNVQRHARAASVDVTVEASRTCLRIMIVDDGKGFDPARVSDASMGIRIMRERAKEVGADLRVISAPDEGCVVSVELPLAGAGEMEEAQR